MVKFVDNQIFRFLMLGGLAAAINWLVRFPLSIVLPIGPAVAVAYLIGMSAGFWLYRTYVFPGSNRSLLQQSLIFVAVNIVGSVAVLGLTFGFLSVFASLRVPRFAIEGLSHGLAIGIGAVINFIGHRTLTFSLKPPLRPGADQSENSLLP